MIRPCVALAALAALVLFAGCDWLFRHDTTPPTCQMASPADSATVNGVVTIAATAADSVGVAYIEFYADGVLLGTDTSESYAAVWDASALPRGSWHSLGCIAYDAAGNKGYSDTVAVEIASAAQAGIYLGKLVVHAKKQSTILFTAGPGDTLAGGVQVASGGNLTKFLWLDQDNYGKFAANEPYAAVYEQDDFPQMSVRQAIPAAGEFRLVFVNSSSSDVECWVRFVLE
jgi:hypothetical protein